MTKQHHETSDIDLAVPWEHGDSSSPGKRSMTQGLTPRPIVFRVESAEAARELGVAFGRRDRNGVAEGAEAAVDQAAGSSGAPLRDDLRGRFESSLGADLSAVRIHTGGASAEASAAVGAKAYTVGNDVHFGAGQYQPDDPFGMHLIAHEVAHTQQQAGGAAHRQHKLEVSTPGDSAEVEADRAADAMVAGQTAAVSSLGAGAQRQVLQRDPVRQGATRVQGQDTNEAEQVLDTGDQAAATARANVDLKIASDVNDTTALLGMVTDNTMNLRHAVVSDSDRKTFHESCAKENDSVIQALGRFQHQAVATQLDIDMFETQYNTMQRDFARLQGMMAQFSAFHPDKGKLSVAQDSNGAGRAVKGGATETDVGRTIESIPDKGVKHGLEERLGNVKQSINNLHQNTTHLPTAARNLSDANRTLLSGNLNVSLGAAKREDDEEKDKDLIEAKAAVEKANKELAAATKMVEGVGKEVTAGLKALEKLPQVKVAVEGAERARDLASQFGGEEFDEAFGDKLGENIAKAITGLGNKVSNAKGIVAAFESKKSNLNLIHHFADWDDKQTAMDNKAKSFAKEVQAAGKRRAAVTKSIRELEDYQAKHKIKGPKGADLAVMAAFVANANMFVAQADATEDMGEDALKRVGDALKHESKQANKDADGKDESTGTGTKWEQNYARQPDPMGGKDDFIAIPGAKVREIRWWACTKGRAGGTVEKPVWGFINRPQTTRLHMNEQTGDNQRLQSVQVKIETMLGNIFVARGSAAAFATEIAGSLGFGGIAQESIDSSPTPTPQEE